MTIGRQIEDLEKQVTDALGLTMVSAAATAAIFSLSMSCLTNTGLKPLVDSFIHLQVIVHVMLINIFSFSSIENFYSYLLKISNAQMYDPSLILVSVLPIEMNKPMNLHFG